MAVIELNDLTKRFGELVAVDHLSFEVESGRVVGFLGPNGAGKTTTLRMLLGLATPTEGSATINGRTSTWTSRCTSLAQSSMPPVPTRGELPGTISASRRCSATSARRESMR